MRFFSLFIFFAFTLFYWTANSSKNSKRNNHFMELGLMELQNHLNEKHNNQENKFLKGPNHDFNQSATIATSYNQENRFLKVPNHEFNKSATSATSSISMDSPCLIYLNEMKNGQINGFLKVPDHEFNILSKIDKSWTSMDSNEKESQVNRYYDLVNKDWIDLKKNNCEILMMCLNNEKIKQTLKEFIPLSYLILYHLLKISMTTHEKKLLLKLYYIEEIFKIDLAFEPLIYIHFCRHMDKTFQLPKLIESITFRLFFGKIMDRFISFFDVNKVKFVSGNSPTYIDIDEDKIRVMKPIHYKFGRFTNTTRTKFEITRYSHDEISFVLQNKNELELFKVDEKTNKKTICNSIKRILCHLF